MTDQEERAKAAWNTGADDLNQWDTLGKDEKDGLIALQPTDMEREWEAQDKARLMFETDQVLKLCGDRQRVGLCIDCGHEQTDVDPDAQRVTCGDCGEPWVYGAERCLELMEE